MNKKISSDDHHRKRRRNRLRTLAIAPTVMTLGNLLCGFSAVIFALRSMYDFGYDFGSGVQGSESIGFQNALLERMMPSFLAVGAGLVVAGMVFDLLDGLIARVTRSTTNFGGQLDSLADVVTFGVAPATLMVALMTQELARDAILPSPTSPHFLGRAAWVSAAVYLSFTAIRLARFNVEHAKADFDHRTFRGMPSPGAACVMVALILFQHEMGESARTVIVYTLPVVAVVLAFLMISRIPYRRFHRTFFLGRQPFSHVVTLIFLLAVFLLIKAPVFLLAVLWYAISGPVLHCARIIRERRTRQTQELSFHPADTERKRA